MLPAAHDAMLAALFQSSSSSSSAEPGFPFDGVATLVGATLVFLIDSLLRSCTKSTTTGGASSSSPDGDGDGNGNVNGNDRTKKQLTAVL